MTNTITTTEARANFQDVLNRVEHGGERIVIERHGKAAAAIVTVEDFKRLEDLEDVIASRQLQQAVEQNNGFTTLEAIVAQRGL
ncbi:hypothetical protein DSM106972_082970 [Dulcicalothrix desertica PCC 7102]|uniref:Antitoxin n=1 Tax=Dulcicalothrix desertica PCC 7102 TaxID=232991 RepID=A0A433UUP9_9CYAN|nr:type II toxin-antitoxin system Phd/YefM family antitoxin [Dulcicalothrix desertica]RUS97560.1 hypothetical protein DSM106972_082970 [Dulcicalothrix desertica PCC 7102]TWH54770.1 prevent-host-death family protein [Dulcicalothrix desertica PCC 7102]